ncbi:hypothetical protein [Methanolacinia paynteri]|uniref:hypothetical protein n=1 Tax=Methanolacinia paynteri TaxID=230356 RepID=UPI001FE17373|nr:hypothetical protein [Methanolacinia paynteri]
MLSIAVIFFLLAIPVCAGEFPVIETGYTYVDGDDDVHFPYIPSDDKTSHAGLSNGEIAYSKNGDPLVYIWDSGTGETKTFDTTELAEKKDNWISFWMDIRSLDLSNGVVYYSLAIHTTTPTGTSASSRGLFSFDGISNEQVSERLYTGALLADNDLVAAKDYSDFDDEPFTEVMSIHMYSHDTGELVLIDNRTEMDDPMGFGEYKVATLSEGISIPTPVPGDRVRSEGIAVFDLEPVLSGGEAGRIEVPGTTDISSNERVNLDQDCFSDRFFVWTKGKKTTEGGIDHFGSILYATDLTTLENTAIDANGNMDFGLYAYAVDGDYLVYKNEGKIFLYHIPDGEKKEIRITGNDEFEVGDIVEFDEGQLLVRAYPKDYPGYDPSEYEIWFVDLNPFINPAEGNESGDNLPAASASETRETPVLFVVPGLAVLIVFALFAFSFWRRG